MYQRVNGIQEKPVETSQYISVNYPVSQSYIYQTPFSTLTVQHRGPSTPNRKIPLSPFAPENLVSRDGFGSSVPRQPAHLHTQAESGAHLRNSSRVPRRRPFIYVKLPYDKSDQSRVYRATQLRTDCVHCRESAGTGPVNLKVVPNECCLGRSPWTN